MNAWEGLDPTGIVSGLLSAAQQVSLLLDTVVADRLNLTLAQFQVLRLIRNNPGVQPSQLSAALGCTRGNITGIVNRLHRDGLVERRHSETDRRMVHLLVTASGERFAGEEPGVRQACLDLVAELKEPDRSVVRRVMAKLSDATGRGAVRREQAATSEEAANEPMTRSAVAKSRRSKQGSNAPAGADPQDIATGGDPRSSGNETADLAVAASDRGALESDTTREAPTRAPDEPRARGVVVVPRQSRRIRVVRDRPQTNLDDAI